MATITGNPGQGYGDLNRAYNKRLYPAMTTQALGNDTLTIEKTKEFYDQMQKYDKTIKATTVTTNSNGATYNWTVSSSSTMAYTGVATTMGYFSAADEEISRLDYCINQIQLVLDRKDTVLSS